MTEEEARAWLAPFGAAAMALLDRYVALLEDESRRQNLIAPSTMATIWVRHIVDSAQLVPMAPSQGIWLDVGSGAGLPGLVVAILRPEPTILVEPRRQRADFLRTCVTALGLDHVEVKPAKVEQVAVPTAIVSARAVAPVEKLLQAAAGCATPSTRWLLPRGRSGEAELAALRQRWRGVFHMKHSVTDPHSTILVLEGPARR